MAISVVIPVYNAEEFIEAAVLSALQIREVEQIILIEDSSPDNCLSICKKMESEYPDIIELYTHPEGKRQGAGASRNLGIHKAKCEYIAFLDADDYYLPHRFEKAMKIFGENSELDYVVSPSQLESDFLNGQQDYTMMGLEANNGSHNLFPALLTEAYGYFDTNSIIIKRDSLRRLSTLFNVKLELHQDSELWLRIAYKLKGYTENTTLPGSIVRRHGKNRITHRNASSLKLYWKTVFFEFNDRELSPHLNRFIRLRKKHYKHLSKGSIWSYWYWLEMNLHVLVARPRILSSSEVLNRYLMSEVKEVAEKRIEMMSS